MSEWRKRLGELTAKNTAAAYSEYYQIASDQDHERRYPLYDAILDYIVAIRPERPLFRVLDVGCGAGHFLSKLHERLRPYPHVLYGVDYAIAGIMKARELLPDAHFEWGDFLTHPLPFSECDLVTCIQTLEHVPDPEAFVRQMVARTIEGGHIIVTIPNGAKDRWHGHANFWTIGQFGRFMGQFGTIRALYHFHKTDNNILCHIERRPYALDD